MVTDKLDGYLRSKLLSQRGCDRVEYSEGDRQTAVSTKVFDKSVPRISEAQYDFDLEVSDEIRSC